MLENEGLGVEEDEEAERDFWVMERVYIEVAEAILGGPRKKKKPWISEESWSLEDQREEINKKIHSTRSERVKKQLKTVRRGGQRDKEKHKSRKKDMD